MQMAFCVCALMMEYIRVHTGILYVFRNVFRMAGKDQATNNWAVGLAGTAADLHINLGVKGK
jgi:hypothetical protein